MESCLDKKQLDKKRTIKFKTTFYLVAVNIVSSSSTKKRKEGMMNNVAKQVTRKITTTMKILVYIYN